MYPFFTIFRNFHFIYIIIYYINNSNNKILNGRIYEYWIWKWKKKYYGEKIVNFSNFLKENDIEILEKLGIKIDLTKIYTEYEYDLLDMELIEYYEDAEYIDGTKVPPEKNVEDYNVSKEDYNRILEIFFNIGVHYEF